MPKRKLTLEEAFERIEHRIRYGHPDRAENNDPFYDEVAAEIATQVDMSELTVVRMMQEIFRKKVSTTVAGLAKSARHFLAELAEMDEQGMMTLLPTLTGREHLILKVPVVHEGRKQVDFVNVRLGVATRDDFLEWARYNQAKLDEDVNKQRKQFTGAARIRQVLGQEGVETLNSLRHKYDEESA